MISLTPAAAPSASRSPRIRSKHELTIDRCVRAWLRNRGDYSPNPSTLLDADFRHVTS